MESNAYLRQVEEQQAVVEQELRQAPLAPAAGRAKAKFRKSRTNTEHEEEPDSLDYEDTATSLVGAPNYRITGFWRWKTVVVSPNAHVVHTRRGHAEPLHVGLGISFRYDPTSDAFLVIPAAVQTLLINARCISIERQGILVQAYVQWIVADVRTAYRKLDFSDRHDPMRIVNVQLREQAEAAIKDKVATMAIDDILSDKQPIIEELTHRLRAVAEGGREGDADGLGLKIVTVQIKEAVVSSTRLWENLQKPFRAERERLAQLAELDAQRQVADQELTNRQTRETGELDYQRRLAQMRAEQERESYDREQAAKVRRQQVEQAAEQQAIALRTATERAARDAELELALQRLELEQRRVARELESVRQQVELERAKAELEDFKTKATIQIENANHSARAEREARDVEVLRARRTVENDVTEAHLRSQLIARLPEVAAALPKPEELRAVSINGDQGGAAPLVGFLAGLLNVADGALRRPAANGKTAEGE
jgi:hypothetical protein